MVAGHNASSTVRYILNTAHERDVMHLYGQQLADAIRAYCKTNRVGTRVLREALNEWDRNVKNKPVTEVDAIIEDRWQ